MNEEEIDVVLKEFKDLIHKEGKHIPKETDQFLKEFIEAIYYSIGKYKYTSREEANAITAYCFRNNPYLEQLHSLEKPLTDDWMKKIMIESSKRVWDWIRIRDLLFETSPKACKKIYGKFINGYNHCFTTGWAK